MRIISRLISSHGVLAAALATGALAFFVFWPSIGNEFVLWDDSVLIYENPRIRSLDIEFFKWAFSSVALAAWYPLTLVSFALDYALWGLDPRGFHLTNVVLHSANTFLVAIVTVRLVTFARTRAPDIGAKGLGAAGAGSAALAPLAAGVLTALLFALHPLRVESVAWTAERKDVLYAFFYLSSVLAYLSYTRCSPKATKRLSSLYLVSLVLFACSLMSKAMAVTLPMVLLILDWYPLGRLGPAMEVEGGGRGAKGGAKGGAKAGSKAGSKATLWVLIEKTPFFILSLVVSIIALSTHGPAREGAGTVEYGIIERIVLVTANYTFYLYKLLLPLDLSPLYPFSGVIRVFSFEYLAPLVLFSTITALAVLYHKKYCGLSAAWAYYLVSLLPVIGVFTIGGEFTVADRYSYLSSLGPFVVVGFLTVRAFEGSRKKVYRFAAVAGVLALLALFSALTIKGTYVWKDSITLWSRVIELYPDSSPAAYNNRGIAHRRLGDLGLAIKDHTRALEIDPGYAKAYNNRGIAHRRSGELARAVADYTRAIELDPRNAKAWSNRGNVLKSMGELDRALEDLSRAARLDPRSPVAYFNRGAVYGSLGDDERAVADFTRAIELDPAFVRAYNNRGVAHGALGELDRALEDFTRAIELDPRSSLAYFNRAKVYEGLGDMGRARRDYDAAFKFGP